MILFVLLVAHAFADFAFQPTDMATGKNRHRRPANLPPGQKYTPCWQYWLTAHALVHGGTLFLLTGSFICGVMETVAHWIIDFMKCENWTNPHTDQLLHFLCKVFYLWMLI